MEIELKEITVRELTNGFEDNEENGVLGFGGKLDIRPPYQREFIYKDKQRDAVINTVTKNYPLNVMYWAVNENGNFEVEFYIQDDELGNVNGHFTTYYKSINLDSTKYIFSENDFALAMQTKYSVSNRDTIIGNTYYIPRKTYIKINLNNSTLLVLEIVSNKKSASRTFINL